MKRIKYLSGVLLIFVLSCQANDKVIVKDIFQDNIKHQEKFVLFDGIIDDFEATLSYWHYDKKLDNNFNRKFIDNLNIGKFIFIAKFSQEEFHPYINEIIYKRKMNFSKYHGVIFYAKGDSRILYKLKILEMEDHFNNQNGYEIWYKVFAVDNQWREFRIDFNDMRVEEYWEQNYISDNIRVFTNIMGISFTAQNISYPKNISGNLYIDNIELY